MAQAEDDNTRKKAFWGHNVSRLPTAAERTVKQPVGWFRDRLHESLPRFPGRYISPAERAIRGDGSKIWVRVDAAQWRALLAVGKAPS